MSKMKTYICLIVYLLFILLIYTQNILCIRPHRKTPDRDGRIMSMHQLIHQPGQPPRHKHPEEIILSEGYPVEKYFVTTEDGYILTLHRIPHGKYNRQMVSRPVVYLQHGILNSDSIWILQTPTKGLGYILADAGYDVWMGNYRGGTYGRNHTIYDPDESVSFWQFSWDEMAKFDLPALIEKVLEITGMESLHYIGYSMGTTTFFAMHHYRKDITKRIKLAQLLSPIGYLDNALSPVVLFAGKNVGNTLIKKFGMYEFLPNTNFMDTLSSKFCNRISHHLGMCTNLLFSLFGYDQYQMNLTLVETIMQHLPAGTSIYAMMQYEQVFLSGEIKGFDWGTERLNFIHHGRNGIPKYRLEDVTTPVAAYYGLNDWLAALPDLHKTLSELPHILHGMVHQIPFPYWNHIDFVFGIEADRYVYKYVLENLKECEEQDCRNPMYNKYFT